ncbi:peptidyl-prolyl cis-trans isomerase [Tenuifilaceae bacterium CYCD]|nr:peptidyl-prolyl cis-trans isomerase [Tenuifilaceae bacterium CYCD]
MKRLVAIVLIAFLASCSKYDKNFHHAKIETEYGNIVVKLYNSTPNHTNNFVKLVDEKFYDGIIFHRVIKDFVIQGGDPDTKNAEAGKLYGEADAGYLVDAEFVDTIIHKKGVIAMAREGDDVNPEKKSSSSQFYIVVGKIFTNEQLDSLEIKLYNKKVSKFESKIFADLIKEKGDTLNNPKLIKEISKIVNTKVDSFKLATPIVKFNELQRKTYTTIGGIPHLDGNYTIFGEVIEGYDAVEKISLVERDENDRPLKDIKMKISLIN